MKFLTGFGMLFCASGLFAQTAHIDFLAPEIVKPVHQEQLENYGKMTLLFGNGWLAPGLVVGVLAPVGPENVRNYFQLGGQVDSYYQARTANLDLSVSARAMYPWGLPEEHGFLNFYVQFLVGPSMYFNSPVNWGYHVGVIPGVRYLLTDHWGVFGELGYSLHTLIASNVPNANLHAGSFSLGVSYEF